MTDLPNGWVETTLGEVINIYSGKTRPKINGIYPVYGGNGILDYANDYNQENETIIIGRVGAYCGNVFFEKKQFWLSDNALGIKSTNISNITFLYYKLKQMKLNNVAIGAAQPLLTQTLLKELEIIIPQSIQEQKAIAKILTAFDDKIELLQAQNKTLETTAQTIFKEWFGKYQIGDELPEGWRVGKLGEEFDIVMGQSPKGSSYNEDRIGTLFFQGRAEFTERFPQKRLYTTEPKRMAEINDVLVSVRAPVGDVNVASESCCIGRGLSAIKSQNKSYALYKIKYLKPQFDLFESEGTVFGSINKNSFSNIEVIIPVRNKIQEFEDTISPLDEKYFNNLTQIQSLKQTRDTLLPKLMSGQLRVDEFKEDNV